MATALGHKEYFAEIEPLEGERLAVYENEVRESLQRQREIENSDETSFADYLANYYSQDGCP
jgi:hypothetical protein